ncbi:hypothetical protein N657DRAFT_202340 [Parathielavia appendiculata]|uniref:Uncharacterized protein n=1 Tax=Parathielavia appendiculata TaxID=2587402 RepID=A0AAN6U6B2_9PEZI|nr:hypothetical protein N657DRAFT_202340 [Parathielavia appendiculata]
MYWKRFRNPSGTTRILESATRHGLRFGGSQWGSTRQASCVFLHKLPLFSPEDPPCRRHSSRTTTRSPAFDPSPTSPCFKPFRATDDAPSCAIGLPGLRRRSVHALATIPCLTSIESPASAATASPWRPIVACRSLHHITAMISISSVPTDAAAAILVLLHLPNRQGTSAFPGLEHSLLSVAMIADLMPDRARLPFR